MRLFPPACDRAADRTSAGIPGAPELWKRSCDGSRTACEALDHELELAIVIGPGTEAGRPIPVDRAEDHIFGFALLNDWSARDIQRCESTPLGPLLGKSFNTTMGAWVVTAEATVPFRAPKNPAPEGVPEPLPYLRPGPDPLAGGLDLRLDVHFSSLTTRRENEAPQWLSRQSFLDMHWTRRSAPPTSRRTDVR